MLRTALLKGLAIICAAPLIATAQDNAITFEQVWVESTAGGIYGGVQTDDALLFAAGEDGIVRAGRRRLQRVPVICPEILNDRLDPLSRRSQERDDPAIHEQRAHLAAH